MKITSNLGMLLWPSRLSSRGWSAVQTSVLRLARSWRSRIAAGVLIVVGRKPGRARVTPPTEGKATEGAGPVDTGEDPLAIYASASCTPRTRSGVFLTPFSVNAFVQGRFALGTGILLRRAPSRHRCAGHLPEEISPSPADLAPRPAIPAWGLR